MRGGPSRVEQGTAPPAEQPDDHTPAVHLGPRPPSQTPKLTSFWLHDSMGAWGSATTPSTSTIDSLGMPHAYLTMPLDTVVSLANSTA